VLDAPLPLYIAQPLMQTTENMRSETKVVIEVGVTARARVTLSLLKAKIKRGLPPFRQNVSCGQDAPRQRRAHTIAGETPALRGWRYVLS